MKMKQFGFVLILLLVIVTTFSGCVPPQDTPLRLYLSGTLVSLEPIIRDSGIDIQITYRGDVEIADTINNLGAFNPGVDVFGVDNQFWINNSRIQEPTTITKSYTTVLVDSSLMELRQWQTGVPLSDIQLREAFRSGQVQLAMSSSSQDDIALSFSLAYLRAAKGTGDPLTTTDLSDESILAAAEELYAAVSNTAGNVSLLYKEELTARLNDWPRANLIVLPENLAISFNQELVENGKPPMTIMYVNGATNMQIYTLGYVKGMDPAKVAKYQSLVEYLSSDAAQERIHNLGFRSSIVGMKLDNPNLAVFNPDWGVLNTEFVLAGMPKPEVIRQFQHLYQVEFKPKSHTVFCLDRSSSMTGDGISQLRSAMFLLLNQEASPENPDEPNAKKYFLEAGPEDMVAIRMFNDEVTSLESESEPGFVVGNNPSELLGLYQLMAEYPPSGGTAMYDCAKLAIEDISQWSQEYKFASVILLTDGQHTAGMSYSEFETYYKGYFEESANMPVPVYIVLLGAADTVEMEKLAVLTNGDWCIGSGGIENMAHCFRRFRSN